MLSEIRVESAGKSGAVWGLAPFQIVSLYEMLGQYAVGFYRIGEILSSMVIASIAQKERGDVAIPVNQVEILKSALKKARSWCETINMGMSVKGIDRLIDMPDEQYTYGTVRFTFSEIQRRVQDELESISFLHIPEASVQYYQNPNSFGDEVVNKIPDVSSDIAEAGSCLATGRFTGCVFHLMRVMERANQELGNKLGIQLTQEKNWQEILDQVNKAIRALNPQTPQDKQVRDSYSAASAHLHNVKEAWRNRVMHPKETYTEEEAKAIFENVKTFITHLAQNVL